MNQGPVRTAAPSSNIDDPATARATPEQWRLLVEDGGQDGGERLRSAGLAILVGLGAAVLALIMFAYVADGVLDSETQQFDQSVLAWIHQPSSPQMDAAAVIVSLFGNEFVGLFMLVLLAWFGYQRRWGAAASLALVVVGAQFLNDVLKTFVHRARPTPTGAAIWGQVYSFPSGHAMMSMALYAFVGYLGWRLLGGWKRVLLLLGLTLVVLLVGLSRLYLEVHYPTDVIAGYLAGFIWADSVLVSAHLLASRRARRKTRAARPAFAAKNRQ